MGRFHVHPDGVGHSHAGGAEDSPVGGSDESHSDSGGQPHSLDIGDHSGYSSGVERITILENILSENDRLAASNRALFELSGVRAVNLMSAPGAGKTTLLEKTLSRLAGRLRVGVLEGDIATELDAGRLAGSGAAAIATVNTSAGFGGECHLDAVMVRSGLSRLPLEALDLLIIENVGNLVCPAEFDVGEAGRAMVYSVTEGEEKPLKYPVMFRAVEMVVVNKIDLLPHLDFDLPALLANIALVNPQARVVQTSARTGEGLEDWCEWLVAGTASS
ncbi:MAG: hydrogenase nickel incorporation protein HypB [Acidimicrobiales bacterium]